ncbi:hypothetical protein [Paraglaciecola sp. L3A3]|uniref:hypothetical protein n=1 Tax=Paraglaciecola sp. L3A3 TaxID=2686358 RepID=UPI001E6267BB|nr:hypothetical protein [Paraglaciecola sp. L3A3]
MSWLAMILIKYNQLSPPKKLEMVVQQSEPHILLEPLVLPPPPNPSQSIKVATKQTAQPKVAAAPAKNAQTVELLYQQLTGEGLDMQIAWPENTKEREGAIQFMYQCVGLQFAVLNGNQITKLNRTKVTNYSDWIRVAQGGLSKKERHLINAYAVKGKAIRLFPRLIDWRLAQYLTVALRGKTLTHFRANYQIKNQQLFLGNIWLNKQAITDSWMLYHGQC